MADTLSNGEDDVEDLVSSSHGDGSYKEVTEKKEEISNAETDKEMVEDVAHLFPCENSKAEKIASRASSSCDNCGNTSHPIPAVLKHFNSYKHP